MKKKIMVVFGTRPEAIKMGPLVVELSKNVNFETIVCVTGQHRQMLDQVLSVFGIEPDFDLSIMKDKQTLFDITSEILLSMNGIINITHPDLVLVHGDTSTTFACALSCFYNQVDVGHVEAGLRTYNLYSPFPEEFNRQSVSLIAKYHFAPTIEAKNNLISEGKLSSNIFVTGNTAIDALSMTIKKDYNNSLLDWVDNSKLILITAHRRENLGEPMRNMFKAIKKILGEFPDLKAIYPIHMNPAVRKIASEILNESINLRIVEPLGLVDFHNLMARSFIILTDSGGIQEEAPSLGVPVLVMRETTERPEGVIAGTLKLVGTDEQRIYDSFKELLVDKSEYERMSNSSNPYGDGTSSKMIVSILEKVLLK